MNNQSSIINYQSLWLGGALAVILVLCSVASGASTDTLTQWGITWTFNHTYDYGTFVNGDYWVVADTNDGLDPNVIVNSVSPPWTGVSHGSMVNPVGYPTKHGYDSRLSSYGYDASYRATYPMTLDPNSSLVSTISWIDANSGDPNYPVVVGDKTRPILRTAAVLTVLASAPDPNAFRPPYAGTSKPIYLSSDLNKDLLSDLAFVGDEVNLVTTSWQFKKVWLDHFSHAGDGTQYTSPTESQMPNNGRDYTTLIGDAIMLLCLDESELVSQFGENKDNLLLRVVQLGIDLQGVIDSNDGAYWRPSGSLNSGRKWPILFAGLMLDDDTMKAIGTNSPDMTEEGFAEDGQTFYVGDREIYSQPYTLNHRTPKYTTGTVGVENGSTTVTGSGTTWVTDDANMVWFGVVGDNQAYALDGIGYEVNSITDGTHLELETAYDGNTSSGESYIMGAWVYYGHGLYGDAIGGDYTEFEESQRGLPEWGLQPQALPDSTGHDWGRKYQYSNGYSYPGYVLSMLIMGQKSAYNHNALFDYTDRYLSIEVTNKFLSDFAENMWDAYRTDYGAVWTAEDITKYLIGVYNP